MARRRHKKRTHIETPEDVIDKTPKSMAIKLTRRGHSTTSLSGLVKDVRQVMQPHTAIKLRERSTNKLRDFVTMTGPLGVSHLMAFSISDEGNTNLRIGRSPRGPTMHFRVTEYSLCKDIVKLQKAPKSPSGILFANPPLLVLNGFSTDRKEAAHEALLTTMFQNMFPPLNVQEISVSSIKRVLVLNKNQETGIIDLRHYAIETKLVDVSKGVKRLATLKHKTHKKIPNLAKASDIADLLTDPYSASGFTSDSEVEEDALVEIEQRKKIRIKAGSAALETLNKSNPEGGEAVPGENEDQQQEEEDKELYPTARPEEPASRVITESLGTQKRAVKLVELGPRLKLDLLKIEDGSFEGKVIYHKYVQKTEQEIKALDAKHEEKQRLKAQRRKIQEENVKKKAAKETRMKRGKEKAKSKNHDDDEEEGGDSGEDDEQVEYSEYEDNDELFASEDEDHEEGPQKKKKKVEFYDDVGEDDE